MTEQGFPNSATPAGSSAYYLCRLAKSSHRDVLADVFLLKKQLTDLYAMQDPGVARLKLQWWQQQFTAQEDSAHPLVKRLQGKLSAASLQAITDIASAIDHQLHRQPLENMQAFQQTAAQIGGGFLRLIDDIEQTQIETDVLSAAGQWIYLIETLQLLGQCRRFNIPALPVEIKLNEDLEHDHTQLSSFVERFSQDVTLPNLSRTSSVNRYLQMQLQLLKLLQKEHYAVLNQKISLTPLRKLWIAWRFS